MRLLSLFIVTLTLTSLMLPSKAMAAKSTNVYYAGFAFASDNDAIKTAFPYTSELLEEKVGGKTARLEAELKSHLKAIKNPNFTLLEEQGDSKSGDAVSLAFAVDWENVSQEKLGSSTKIVVDLHAQILVFDFAEKKLINAFPIRMQIIDNQSGEVSHKHILGLFHDIYYGASNQSIFDVFVNRMNTVTIKPTYGHRIRVTSVTLEDKAHKTLAEAKENENTFKSFAARIFSESLSDNQSMAVMPYSKGQVIGGKMAARFYNGDVYQLEIPEPDYTIKLVIRGFKKVKADETSAETAWAYGSFAHVTIELPELHKVYMDTDFKYAVSKTVPLRLTKLDDWTAYQESLLALFDNITRQISAQNSDWIEKWATGDQVNEQFIAVEKIVKECR